MTVQKAPDLDASMFFSLGHTSDCASLLILDRDRLDVIASGAFERAHVMIGFAGKRYADNEHQLPALWTGQALHWI
jgi:hypothetical protein